MTMAADDLHSSKKTKCKEQAKLFDKRAIGLINVAFDECEDNALKLIRKQSKQNQHIKDLLIHSLLKGDRDLFGTDAYVQYMKKVWLGKEKPAVTDLSQASTGDSSQVQDENSLPAGKGTKLDAPVTKYIIHFIFFIGFLAVFGHTLLFAIRPTVSGWEIAVTVWWCGLLIEEIIQFQNPIGTFTYKICKSDFCGKFYRHFAYSTWNILDAICHGTFLIGACLITSYHVTRAAPVLEAARVVLSLNMMFYIWRVIQYLTIFNIIGTVFEMIIQTMKVLFPFLVIMAVFIVAKGVASYALLYPEYPWSWPIFLDIPKSGFWNIFGYLELSDIEDTCSGNPTTQIDGSLKQCASSTGSYFAPFILAVHMVVTNVIILNLLIAQFTNMYGEMQTRTESLAAWHKAKVTLEFYRKSIFPPPLNILYYTAIFIKKRICRVGQVEDVATETTKSSLTEDLQIWEREMGQHYLDTHEIKHGKKKISLMKGNNDDGQMVVKGSHEHQQIIRLLCDMDHHLHDTQEKVEGLKHKIDSQAATRTSN